MDDKMIAVVFDNEKKAYEGSKALKDLHDEGSITLYASAVIAKDADEKVTVKQAADQGPLGTAVGLVTGSLIGLLGRPVGVAIGAYVGTVGGVLYDLAKVGVGEDFLDEVGQRLGPGKVAVVAEVWEEWRCQSIPVWRPRVALSSAGLIDREKLIDLVEAKNQEDLKQIHQERIEEKLSNGNPFREDQWTAFPFGPRGWHPG